MIKWFLTLEITESEHLRFISIRLDPRWMHRCICVSNLPNFRQSLQRNPKTMKDGSAVRGYRKSSFISMSFRQHWNFREDTASVMWNWRFWIHLRSGRQYSRIRRLWQRHLQITVASNRCDSKIRNCRRFMISVWRRWRTVHRTCSRTDQSVTEDYGLEISDCRRLQTTQHLIRRIW